MGLISGKNQQDKAAQSLDAADKITQGKGLSGRLAKSMMGSESLARMQAGVASAKQMQDAQDALASGAAVVLSTVLDVRNTGTMVNNNPMVGLSVKLDGSQEVVELQTVVPITHIPQAGMKVHLTQNPHDPSGFVYVGIAG